MTWHDVAYRSMTWHDVRWRGVTWHDMTLRDMTIKLTIKRWSCDRPSTFARLLINLELFCQGTIVWANGFQLSRTIQDETIQKCRETIPLVQVCFRFELSFTVLKLLSKILVNPWNFDQIFAVFDVFLREIASEEFWNYRIIQTTYIHTRMFFLPDINQLGLGKRRWNRATCSAVVEFCIQCLPTNIVRILNENWLCKVFCAPRMVPSVQMFWWLGLLQSKVAIACAPLALAKLCLHSSAFCTLVHSRIRCQGPKLMIFL